MAALYDEDLALWAEQQGRLLRAAARERRNEPLDWDNLAEEIETLGNSEVSELRSRLMRIVEHLLKLQFSLAQEPRRGWQEAIGRQRVNIEAVLETSPSLRRRLPELLEWAAPRGARETARRMSLWGETEAAEAVKAHGGRYELRQVLEEWPPNP